MVTPVWSGAALEQNVLMKDAGSASEKFHIANEDMDNWQKLYYDAVNDFKNKMIPEYICPDADIPLHSLTKIEGQIAKVC